MEYCVLDLGVRHVQINRPATGSPPPRPPDAFKCDREYYAPIDRMVDVKSVLRNVRRVPEYTLRERTDAFDSSIITLGVFLRMRKPNEEISYRCNGVRQQLCALLFREIEHSTPVKHELATQSAPSGPASPISVTQFYHQLRLRHQAVATAEPEPAKHPLLRPELRPYQLQALRWMMGRETETITLPAQYVRLRSASIPEVDFYRDLYSYEVFDAQPPPIPIPPGGILADEMGLGKTVEILALLLANPRRRHDTEFASSTTPRFPSVKGKKSELKCLCMNTRRNNTIGCRKCGRLQHRSCVLRHRSQRSADREYLCPECWRTEPLVESGATIIVSPVSIKHQWASEIAKHINKPDFSVFLYDGVSGPTGWISPADLATYDVVLTDYNVLKPEIYFTEVNKRQSRHEKRFLTPSTPLTMVRWWRVCLDEAQMVEEVHNNATKMVKALPAVHRWTVTGTPIEKTINNLYGLVHYLDYAPYSDHSIWRQYSNQFATGNPRPLLTMMARIMWRTCKAAVLEQLGIPPQTERVHYITMSSLQAFFYRTEHTLCACAFRQKAHGLGASDQSMAKLNIHTLNLLMEPLRKLRQDCTIPSVLHVGGGALQAKKLLTPTELHEHLVTCNVNDCKSQLRTIVSMINGLAALHVLQHEPEQAIRLYLSTLRWADDYTGAISVDSLLQIHALHNLIELTKSNPPPGAPSADQLREYGERCARLEWRYIEQYASKIRTVETDLRPAVEKVDEMEGHDGSPPSQYCSWWLDLFHYFEANPQRGIPAFQRIAIQPEAVDLQLRSWRGVALVLTNWWDRIIERRSALKAAFAKLEFFVENLKPNHEWASGVRVRIERLVSTAFACHLDPALHADSDEAEVDRTDRGPPAPRCLLCMVKDTVQELEAILFAKVNLQTATGGLYQMTKEETLLKHLQTLVKREHGEESIVAASDTGMAYLERIKTEMKEYSRYWVEINYTVAAYDELKMCKSRLQLISDAEYRELEQAKKKPSVMQLLAYEIPEQMRDLKTTKAEAERSFMRLQGTRKYLEHLSARREIDPCPICQTVPDTRYAVLQCGHHVCSVCTVKVLDMARATGGMTSCGICRHRQSIKHIHYVTLTTETQQYARGNYSNKILKIIETVLELRAAEPDVKIVIFSYWQPILVHLGGALNENEITYRQKSTKFYTIVDEFKDYTKGVTCLLLPLQYGSKGLNLTEATHVFLVEPILNPGEELQAIGRVHRIGQTRPTVVHRFIVRDTIEETIHDTIQADRTGRWLAKDVTIRQLEQLFSLDDDQNAMIVL
ncbi:E3 ubiquitin-protein ligase SHPRH [Anopheles bellator]|uniref:E3 ubiquitin-protein ligase SHPRH n=1 Tax=Anopheles bellator TaxID=139047 RepID=UPI0026495F67|nr:E3 ubiquitin-protein ligase SHPRH [Anopheles bellator]